MLDFSSAGLRSLAAPVGGLIDRCNPRVQRLRRVSEVSADIFAKPLIN